jgi:class 3 adenylate cyclase
VHFQLEDETLAALTDARLYAHPEVHDDAGRGLVWTGGLDTPPSPPTPAAPSVHPSSSQELPPAQGTTTPAVAERRQLTGLFCDLVASTALASQRDPADLRDVIRAYQAACAAVIQRFDGHTAQWLGDGVLVYFGSPQAHEDEAQRAVRTGLGIIEALGMRNTRLERDKGIRLAVRRGIHTGLVVVGAMGGGDRQEQLAVGDPPNIAARLQGLAPPDAVLISEATARLVAGYFLCQPLGAQLLRGVARTLQVSHVLRDSGVYNRLELTPTKGLTPLVGREAEVRLLLERWGQVQDGFGQVILVSGEAGMGKSRLVHVLKDQIGGEASTRIACRCLPSYQYTAFSPVMAPLQRALGWGGEDAPLERLRKLEEALAQHPQSLPEVVPLCAALLSVPLPDRYPPRTLTPQKQKQKTLEALLAWLLAEAARQPVLLIVEDLHWVDPSTIGCSASWWTRDRQRACAVCSSSGPS